MIDFNKGKEIFNKFRGSEVKTTILYENEVYMIKYPDPIRDKRNVLSYMNNQFSEHIGSRIFETCGMNAQETALGYFKTAKGMEKVVVGCKDFTQSGGTLIEFSMLENQILVEGKHGNRVESVYDVVNQSDLINNKIDILEKFWDMFVIDTLIGNPDRHFDNWGLFEKNGNIEFAPIYDCGSSLAALIDDDIMEEMLADSSAFKSMEFNITSVYYMDGKRIFYHEIYKNPPADLIKAIIRIVPNIDMEKIHGIVDATPSISNIRKEYLKRALSMRYEQILKPALNRATV